MVNIILLNISMLTQAEVACQWARCRWVRRMSEVVNVQLLLCLNLSLLNHYHEY